MKFFWQREDSKAFNHDDFKVSPTYEPYQRVIITVLTIIFIPFMLVLYPVYKLLDGALTVATQFAFYVGPKFFKDRKKSAPHSIYQWIRSHINTKASRIPHINSGFRKVLYRMSGMKIGKGVFVGGFGVLDDVDPQNIIIEDRATISFDVTIVAHGPRPHLKDGKEKLVIFREYSYVGAGSLILPGVEIGTYAIVGAGAVVTKDVPPGAVVGGCPARILYYRDGWGPEGKIEETK